MTIERVTKYLTDHVGRQLLVARAEKLCILQGYYGKLLHNKQAIDNRAYIKTVNAAFSTTSHQDNVIKLRNEYALRDSILESLRAIFTTDTV